MFKRASTSRQSRTPSDRPPDAALLPLAELRQAIDTRLAALEDALADPGQSESITGLILDLTRVATEEAQAAATEACAALKAEADRNVADVRASAQTALDAAHAAAAASQAALEQEREAAVELQRAIDRAREEIDKQAELLAAREQLEAGLRGGREQLEAQLATERSEAAELHRSAADAAQQLNAERQSSADLRHAAELADAQAASLTRAQAAAEAAHQSALADLARAHDAASRSLARERDAASADLAREREAAAARERELVDLRAQLEAERNSSSARDRELTELRTQFEAEHDASAERDRAMADLQAQIDGERADAAERCRAAERAAESAAAVADNPDRTEVEALEAELARQQDIAARLQRNLRDAEEALEAEQASKAALSTSIESTDHRLAAARAAEAQAIADAQREVAAARIEIETLRADLQAARASGATPSPAPDGHAGTLSSVPPAPAAPAAVDTTQGEWHAVRLAERYVFRDALTVQINGNSGLLFDVSVSGCQVLSVTAIKPNHAVKVLLSADDAPLACAGKVVWTRLEPASGGRPLGYRAGVRFNKPDEAAIEAFAARHMSA